MPYCAMRRNTVFTLNEALMAIHKLTARFVETAKDGLHADGGNLYLQVSNGGKGRSWIFQYKSRKDGRSKNMGLGSAATVPLAVARARRRKRSTGCSTKAKIRWKTERTSGLNGTSGLALR